jgi:tetratricopeptide (TPR) repeat protein
MKEAIHTATSRPLDFLRMQGNKILALFNNYEAGDHYDIDFMGQFAPFFSWPFLSAGLIVPLGLAGLLLHANRPPIHGAVAVLFLVYLLSLLPFQIIGRYRLPLMVVLIPFASLGIQEMLNRVSSGQIRASMTYLCSLTVFLVVANLPVSIASDLTGYYNIHAWVLSQKGLQNEAVDYWKRSSEMNGRFSDYARISLAERALKMVEISRGLDYLNQVSDASFAASSKYELLGDYWMLQNQPSEAIACYDRALDINSGKLSARNKLVTVLAATQSPRVSHERARLIEIAALYPPRTFQ